MITAFFIFSPSCIDIFEHTPDEMQKTPKLLFDNISDEDRSDILNLMVYNIPKASSGIISWEGTYKNKRIKSTFNTEHINGSVRFYGSTTNITKEYLALKLSSKKYS